jgi:hypothetical protein
LPAACTATDGQPVGSLTSLASAEDFLIALAMLQRSHAALGNSVLAGGVTWTILRHA